MAAPQYTVPWALERIVAELGQSEANLTQPTSDLYANRLLRVLNSEYMLLSSEGMAKGHPLLMRYVNVTADENGKVEDFRWYADRGDLIGLCPRRNAEDLEPDSMERRHFSTFHQMGYGLSDHRNTEHDFDSAGVVRVYNTRHRHFRLWYVRKPAPLICGRADRCIESIDFKPERVQYGWSILDETSDFSDESVFVWDKSPYTIPSTGKFRIYKQTMAHTLGANLYRISSFQKTPTNPTQRYSESEGLEPGEYNYAFPGGSLSSSAGGYLRFNLYSNINGNAFIPLLDIFESQKDPPYGPLLSSDVFWRPATDSSTPNAELLSPNGAAPDGTMMIGDIWDKWFGTEMPNGVMSWSILPWFPSRFMELLVYRSIYRLKRVSTHDRFLKEEAEMQQKFDQWIERFDQATSPQTGVDHTSPSLTEGGMFGVFGVFGRG